MPDFPDPDGLFGPPRAEPGALARMLALEVTAELETRRERTQRQIEASRRNGARSKGPRTTEGRARSARNAVRHGLTTTRWAVLEDEDASALAELRAAMVAELAPLGALETTLVERAATAMWRLGRSDRAETAVWRLHRHADQGEPDHGPHDLGTAMALDCFGPQALFLVLRYRTGAQLELARSLRLLATLQAERCTIDAPPQPPPPSDHRCPVPDSTSSSTPNSGPRSQAGDLPAPSAPRTRPAGSASGPATVATAMPAHPPARTARKRRDRQAVEIMAPSGSGIAAAPPARSPRAPRQPCVRPAHPATAEAIGDEPGAERIDRATSRIGDGPVGEAPAGKGSAGEGARGRGTVRGRAAGNGIVAAPSSTGRHPPTEPCLAHRPAACPDTPPQRQPPPGRQEAVGARGAGAQGVSPGHAPCRSRVRCDDLEPAGDPPPVASRALRNLARDRRPRRPDDDLPALLARPPDPLTMARLSDRSLTLLADRLGVFGPPAPATLRRFRYAALVGTAPMLEPIQSMTLHLGRRQGGGAGSCDAGTLADPAGQGDGGGSTRDRHERPPAGAGAPIGSVARRHGGSPRDGAGAGRPFGATRADDRASDEAARNLRLVATLLSKEHWGPRSSLTVPVDMAVASADGLDEAGGTTSDAGPGDDPHTVRNEPEPAAPSAPPSPDTVTAPPALIPAASASGTQRYIRHAIEPAPVDHPWRLPGSPPPKHPGKRRRGW